jgi:hypothetical protein
MSALSKAKLTLEKVENLYQAVEVKPQEDAGTRTEE